MDRLFDFLFLDEECERENTSLGYWRQLLYAIVAVFVVVGGLAMSIFGSIAFIEGGNYLLAIVDVVIYVIIAVFTLVKHLPKYIRYIGLVIWLYFIGIFLLIFTGSTGASDIFIMLTFVVAGFLLEIDDIKSFVVINLLIHFVLTILMLRSAFDLYAINDYKHSWFVHLASLQMASITIVVLIYYTMTGLANQIKKTTLNELRMKSIVESMSNGVLLLNKAGIVTDANSYMEQCFGLPTKVLLGKHINQILPLYDHYSESKINNLLETIIKNGNNLDAILINREEKHFVACKLTKLKGNDIVDNEYVIIVHDVTDFKEAESNINHSRKMEAIGTIAGGIAHDFNNMLGGILGYAQLSTQLIEDEDSKLSKYNQRIVDASIKASKLTKQLLTYARKEDIARKPFDLNEAVSIAISLMERTFEKKIEIIDQLYDGNLTVSGDEALIENAMLNLGLNAKDAMKHGGKLTIQTKLLYLDTTYCKNSEFELFAGEYASLIFKDQGHGMSKEIQQRIFEPFFTTKEVGKGTGLGLSATYGAVVSHHGEIKISSVMGMGTTIEILLPIHKEVQTKKDIEVKEHYKKHDDQLILVVDDEEVINNMLAEMLRMLGCRVLQAKDGYEALELFDKYKDQIDGVFLDMIMPKMTGKETLVLMKAIKKDAKIVIISGFLNEENIEDLYNEGAEAIVNKPFTLATIRESLEIM